MSNFEKMDTKFDQQKHPEIKEGERFIGNILGTDQVQFMKETRYKNKRFGQVAYDDSGNVIEESSPLFVSKKEYEELQREYEELGKKRE